LNPAYRADEFEFYLSDLKAKVLLIERDKSSPAVEVANKLGVPIVRLTTTPDKGAGSFVLEFPGSLPVTEAPRSGPAAPEDIALVLHTSGTTSRP
jgi:acyl-CoA synthetase (AMP-forming)/AMP-acid ligase II